MKDAPADFSDAGYGRVVHFQRPQKFVDVVQRIMEGLGKLPALSIALPQSLPHEMGRLAHKISSIGICAGSGGSMLGGLDVDMLFTGELSHHEALAAIEQGRCVVTAFHSNTERAFLRARMRPQLQSEIARQLRARQLQDLVSETMVQVSLADNDPFEIVTAEHVDMMADWKDPETRNGV